jgi:hypothetical protein
MPRSFAAGEHYDDHQNEIVEAFRDRGLIQVAQTEEELAVALGRVAERRPIVATIDHSLLIEHLRGKLCRFKAIRGENNSAQP